MGDAPRPEDEEGFFFVDTAGDPELAFVAGEPASEPPKEHQKDFLPLNVSSHGKGKKNNNKGKGKRPVRRGGGGKKKGNSAVDGAEEDLDLLADYIANADLDELEIQRIAQLADLSLGEGADLVDRLYADEFSDEDDEDSSSYESLDDEDFSEDESTEDSEAERERFMAERLATHNDPGLKNFTLGAPMSKAQRKKVAKESRREKSRAKREAKGERAAHAKDLAKILAKSKDHLDPSVVLFIKKENEKIKDFVCNPEARPGDSLVLAPTPAPIRRIFFLLANAYSLTPKTRGRAKEKVSVMIKTGTTHLPTNWEGLVDQIVAKETQGNPSGKKMNIFRHWNGPAPSSGPKNGKKGKKIGAPGNSASTPRMGDIVGGNAKPVSESNIGHKLLMSMGWKPGESLGDGTSGLKEPVQVTIRSKRGGLGTE